MKRWITRQGQPNKFLQKELKISSLLSLILSNRGIEDFQSAHNFLHGTLSDLESPFAIKNMDRAVDRIKLAVKLQDKVLVWGDYDVDGTTGAATLYSALQRMGAKVNTYIPHRIHDGYGLSIKGIQKAIEDQVDLLITVDNGITAKEPIDYAINNGIDVIVVDHHHPQKEKFPGSAIIIDPLQEGCESTFKGMTAAGLAFKVAWALIGKEGAQDYLQLAAAGTVADMGPLVGENRILVKAGLAQMNQKPRTGLKALLSASRLKAKKVDAGHLGFIVGPRINAAGRMSSASAALKLLTTTNMSEANELAQQLEKENKERQRVEQQTVREAVKKVKSFINLKENKAIIVEDEKWHPGVIGIVASRLVNQFNRPAFVIAMNDGVGKGSGRSIKNFHLVEALEECGEYLKEFGGHQAAAGLSIAQEKLADFKEKFNTVATERLTPEDLVPILETDGEVTIDDLDLLFFEEIDLLEPYGVGNPRPIFFANDLEMKSAVRLLGSNTIRFNVGKGKKHFPALGFRMADHARELEQASKVSLAFTPMHNEWQGERYAELRIEDIKV